MKRNQLHMQTKTKNSMKMPAEYGDKISEFHHFIIYVRRQHKLEPVEIRNMDKVFLTFDVLSNKPVNTKAQKVLFMK